MCEKAKLYLTNRFLHTFKRSNSPFVQILNRNPKGSSICTQDVVFQNGADANTFNEKAFY